MGKRKYFKDSEAYKRILWLLDYMWLSEPDEYKVDVTLRFRHADGQHDMETVQWVNPKFVKPEPPKEETKPGRIHSMSWGEMNDRLEKLGPMCDNCLHLAKETPWYLDDEPYGYEEK